MILNSKVQGFKGSRVSAGGGPDSYRDALGIIGWRARVQSLIAITIGMFNVTSIFRLEHGTWNLKPER